MLTDPPIDKLIDKAGCRYSLVCAIGNRAREISNNSNSVNYTNEKAVTVAAKEFYSDNYEIVQQND